MGLAHLMEDAAEGINDLVKRQGTFLDNLLGPLSPRQQQNTRAQVTVVAITTMTAPKTFSGDAIYVTQTADPVAGGAIFQSRTAAAATTTADSESAAASSSVSVASSSAARTTASPTPTSLAAATTTQASRATTSAPSVLTPTGTKNNLGAAVNSSSSSAVPTETAASGGLSGGAKAGIAFGVLIPLAALLIGLFLLMRRKKQKREEGERLSDYEKTPFSGARAAVPSSVPALPRQMTPSPMGRSRSQEGLAAPRLSLRPLTQFDPRMSKLESPGTPNGYAAFPAGLSANALAVGAAGAAAGAGAAVAAGASANRPQTSRGPQQNMNDPANPFGDHARNGSPTALATGGPRSPSPAIHPSDFPLPVSAAASDKAISLRANNSMESLVLPTSAPTTPSTTSFVSCDAGVAASAVVGAAAVAGGVAAAAGGANTSPRRNNPAPVDNVYRVQLDFKPSMEDELEIRAGQLVRCLHEYDDGWALCMRMDRSQQGVVPRACLSKNTVKPRQGPPPGMRAGAARGPMQGPGMRGPPGPPGPGRPMTPQGHNMPGPGYGPGPGPQSGYLPQPQSMAPGRQGANLNASSAPQYAAYSPQPQAPNPTPQPAQPSAGAPQPQSSPVNAPAVPHPTSLVAGGPESVARKPVPGQAV